MRYLSHPSAILIATALTAPPSHAAEWKIQPEVRLRAGYNDNITLRADDGPSSPEITFSPSTTFSVETPTSGASGRVRFDFRRFTEESELDDNNSRLDLNTFHSTERSRFGFDLNFTKDTTLDSQLETTGLILDRVRRFRIDASPNWTYSFNSRTSLTTRYSYSDVEYKNAGGTGLSDFTLNSFQLSLSRIMTERLGTTLTLYRTQSDNENDVESTNTNLQGGISYRFSQTLSTSLFAGVRRTEVDISRDTSFPIISNGFVIGSLPGTSSEKSSDWGSTYSASIAKTFSRGESTLSASRDISNDINGAPIDVIRLQSHNRYQLSEIVAASLDLEYYISDTNSIASTTLNREYYQIKPGFNWRATKFLSLSGYYRYRLQTFDNSNDDATQNVAYLTLIYRWPRIAHSR